MRLENIVIGAMGWDCESFYPEDLPASWRLDYYANHFSAVLVPSSQWPWWQAEDWDAFLESGDTLRWVGFGVKTTPDDAEAARLNDALERMAERGQAVGLFSHVPLPDVLMKWPVTWFGCPAVDAKWRWEHLSGEPAGWADTLPTDARAQRQILESFAASLPQEIEGAPFIVKTGCDNMQQLKAFKQLCELLGL